MEEEVDMLLNCSVISYTLPPIAPLLPPIAPAPLKLPTTGLLPIGLDGLSSATPGLEYDPAMEPPY